MQIVIDIPEELKNKIDNANENNYKTYLWWFETTLYYALKNGIPLDEQLKDIRAKKDSHCSDNRDRNDGLYIAMKIIDNASRKKSKKK